MIEDTHLMVWAEELADKIVASICDVISKEGVNNPVSVVEREYKRLSPEKQFLLQYMVVTRKQKYSENGNRGTAKSGTRIQ